jgi:hypothetical protein
MTKATAVAAVVLQLHFLFYLSCPELLLYRKPTRCPVNKVFLAGRDYRAFSSKEKRPRRKGQKKMEKKRPKKKVQISPEGVSSLFFPTYCS